MNGTTPFNFAGLPEQYSQYEKSKIVILPVSFNKTSTWLKGSDKGPRAIIDASRNLELYDIETNSEVYIQGIFTAETLHPHDSESMIKDVYENIKRYLSDGKFVVVLGGEHSISFSVVKAHLECYPNMSVLQLDAHTDMRDSYEGNRYSHACVMSRVREITKNITSVGIRSMDSSELKNLQTRRVIFAKDIQKSAHWKKKVLRQFSQQVFITIDLDVFDPGIMPSTGTPEPGGLSWYQCLSLLNEISRKKHIVGFDVVELCPSSNRAPDFFAAKLIYKLLSYIWYYL